MDYGNTKTPSMHRRLGSATLSQQDFPGENNPNIPWEKSQWYKTVTERERDGRFESSQPDYDIRAENKLQSVSTLTCTKFFEIYKISLDTDMKQNTHAQTSNIKSSKKYSPDIAFVKNKKAH